MSITLETIRYGFACCSCSIGAFFIFVVFIVLSRPRVIMVADGDDPAIIYEDFIQRKGLKRYPKMLFVILGVGVGLSVTGLILLLLSKL